MLILFITLAVVFRVATLLISISNERKLKAAGGTEIGKTNSGILAVAHVAFYLCAITEYGLSDYSIDAVTLIGLGIYLVGCNVPDSCDCEPWSTVDSQTHHRSKPPTGYVSAVPPCQASELLPEHHSGAHRICAHASRVLDACRRHASLSDPAFRSNWSGGKGHACAFPPVLITILRSPKTPSTIVSR